MKTLVFALLLATTTASAFVVVLEAEDRCAEEIHNVCHGAMNTTAVAECIVDHEKQLEAVCGQRIECFADEYRDCGSETTPEARFACLEKKQKSLEKECPMLDCEILTHKLCGASPSPAAFAKCAQEHADELKKVCHPPKEVESAMAAFSSMISTARKMIDQAVTCRQEIHQLCANVSSDPQKMLACLEANEVTLAKVCGKSFECAIDERRDCGFNKTKDEWMTCLEKNVEQLAPTCPQVRCEVAVYSLCNASHSPAEIFQCMHQHKAEIDKACRPREEDEGLIDIDALEVPEAELDEETEDNDSTESVASEAALSADVQEEANLNEQLPESAEEDVDRAEEELEAITA